jgi:hypothetical protein
MVVRLGSRTAALCIRCWDRRRYDSPMIAAHDVVVEVFSADRGRPP